MDIFELEEDNQEPESDDEPDGPEPENDVAAPTLPPFMDTPDAATKLNRASSAMDSDDGLGDGYDMQNPMTVQFPEINLPPAESSDKGIDRREYTYLVPEPYNT